MAAAGVGLAELAHGVGIGEGVLIARLESPMTFTARELILVSMVLGCDASGLLPCAACLGDCVVGHRPTW